MPFLRHCHCFDENAKSACIAKVMGIQQKASRTDETAMGLEEDDTLPPATLASPFTQKVESKTKPIRQDVAAIKNENKKLKSEMEKMKRRMKALTTGNPPTNSNKSKSKSTPVKNSPHRAAGGTASPKQSSTTPRGLGGRGRGRGNTLQNVSSSPGDGKQRSRSPKSSSNPALYREETNSCVRLLCQSLAYCISKCSKDPR